MHYELVGIRLLVVVLDYRLVSNRLQRIHYRIPEGWCVATSDNTKRSRYVEVYVDGTFKNGLFCAGFDTYVYYDDVSTYAVYNGNVSGWFDSTWANEPPGCPHLHWVADFNS